MIHISDQDMVVNSGGMDWKLTFTQGKPVANKLISVMTRIDNLAAVLNELGISIQVSPQLIEKIVIEKRTVLQEDQQNYLGVKQVYKTPEKEPVKKDKSNRISPWMYRFINEWKDRNSLVKAFRDKFPAASISDDEILSNWDKNHPSKTVSEIQVTTTANGIGIGSEVKQVKGKDPIKDTGKVLGIRDNGTVFRIQFPHTQRILPADHLELVSPEVSSS